MSFEVGDDIMMVKEKYDFDEVVAERRGWWSGGARNAVEYFGGAGGLTEAWKAAGIPCLPPHGALPRRGVLPRGS